MKWGVYDTVDHCWMGTPDGPFLYDEEELGKLAAQILNERFLYPLHRLVPKEYTQDANVLKDERTPELTADEALDRMENPRWPFLSKPPKKR